MRHAILAAFCTILAGCQFGGGSDYERPADSLGGQPGTGGSLSTGGATSTEAPDGAPEGTACPGIGEIWCNGHCSPCGMNTPGAGAEFVCAQGGCVAVCSAGFERVSMSQPENACCFERTDGGPTVVDGVPSCDSVAR